MQQMRDIAELQRQRAQLTAEGVAAEGAVTVVVNADNIVVATRFDADSSDLDLEELAQAVTAAAQKAAAAVAEKSRELAAPVVEARGRLPKLSELLPGLPDIQEHIPVAPPAPLTEPAPPELPVDVDVREVRDSGGAAAAPMEFTDVENPDESQGSEVADSSW
ncbi:YbaB/EbfC family nucleoid-associated protein [Nocardia sp. NPDC127579]|uniref:YbaB/EbfC family nucleoid-associated protein n=1 Tax=Nocardia sp. NPDC127579 TaxID=3345402 RepID=UPI0036324D87